MSKKTRDCHWQAFQSKDKKLLLENNTIVLSFNDGLDSTFTVDFLGGKTGNKLGKKELLSICSCVLLQGSLVAKQFHQVPERSRQLLIFDKFKRTKKSQCTSYILSWTADL